LRGITPGEHWVRLDGIADNCTLTGDNPRTASVAPADTVHVGFSLSCVATGGVLQVAVRTTGPTPDGDGYLISLDAGPEQPIGSLAVRLLRGLDAGDTAVARPAAPVTPLRNVPNRRPSASGPARRPKSGS